MSTALVQIDVTDRVSGMVGLFEAQLRNRLGLNQSIGLSVRNLVRDHLLGLAETRHDTARALGAQPSGHLGRAAENTTFDFDQDYAKVGINSPGIARAVRDITITPQAPRKFLTFPVIAEAYNQRAYRVRGLVAIITGTTGVLMMPRRGRSVTYKTRRYSGPDKYKEVEKKGGRFGTVWYVLVRSVTQRQDRTLLPTDSEITDAALAGVGYYIDYLIFLQEGGRK